MKEELTIIKASDYGIEDADAQQLRKGLKVYKDERQLLAKEFDEVSTLEINEDTLPKFRELRLRIVKNRTSGIAAWHKKNKAYFLTGGKFVDAIKNKESYVNESMESTLLKAEKHFENMAKERLQKLQDERVNVLSEYVEDAHLRVLCDMDIDVWEAYLSVAINKYEEKRIEAQKLIDDSIEEKRIEDERLEKQRIENIRLKKEAKKRDDKIEKERIANEKKQKIADAEIKAEKDKAAKLQKEIDDKKAEEDEVERLRIKAENDAKIEAEKQAKAPIKKRMNLWVDGFKLDEAPVQNRKTKLIEAKFQLFKKWATTEIKTL